MVKIGPVVTTQTGSCCHVRLDSGERILVAHHEAQPGVIGPSPRLTVERLKFLGFASEPAVELPLAGDTGLAVIARITFASTEQGLLLRRFLAYLFGRRSVAEVVARCRPLHG